MKVEIYMHEKINETSFRVLKLLTINYIQFITYTFDDEVSMDLISEKIGKRIRKLPQVVVDNEPVGGYYDVMEYLINKKIINYEGTSCRIPNK